MLTARAARWDTDPVLIDLHNHTFPLSWDSLLAPDELAVKAKEAGLDALCLTEHDQFWDPVDAHELGRKHGLLVLPGCEITTEDGHMLAYGLNHYAYGMHRVPFLKEEIEAAGGVMIVAHPYRRSFREEEGPWVPSYDEQIEKAGQNQALNLAVAVEVVNGRGTARQNRFSADVAALRGMKAAAGSDSHRVDDIGACATEFSRPVGDMAALVTELRAGRFRPVTLRNGAEVPAGVEVVAGRQTSREMSQ